MAALGAASLLLAGCGYIGSTQPPLANIPGDPTDLVVIQRGATIYAHFKLPELTTELRPINGNLELEARAGLTPAPWNLSQWAESAQKLNPHTVKAGVAQYQFPSLAWTGKEITIGARVIGENRKASNWTSASLPVVAPLTAPADFHVDPTATGVRLSWSGPGQHFRILRSSDASPDYVEIGTTATHDFFDTTAEFGKSYAYLVQSYEDLGNHREAQSDLSSEQALSYKDIFPPAAPTGLRASSSPNTIELSWDANSEPDLAGYRVYRSVNGGAFEKISEVSEIPTYSDKAVGPGKTYRYSVAAVDKSGNESAHSPVVEAAL